MSHGRVHVGPTMNSRKCCASAHRSAHSELTTGSYPANAAPPVSPICRPPEAHRSRAGCLHQNLPTFCAAPKTPSQ
eukprot:scaffold9776_cov126-Isochrysis_galbana.AAC.8